MAQGMENIDHVVVVMLENRSLDNLLGWMYTPADPPAHVLPPGKTPPFDGLAFLAEPFANPWSFDPGALRVPATQPAAKWPNGSSPYVVPTPDPGESFANMTRQLFGPAKPTPGVKPSMQGFLADYHEVYAHPDAAQIMQQFAPEQVGVLGTLAREFALCDAWYASAPCQTWPNRGFAHTGSADGHVNNGIYLPYDVETVFNVLYAKGVSWGVYADTIYTPSLTHLQFPKLWDFVEHFHYLSTFEALCKVGTGLPSYVFLEPRFEPEIDLDAPGDWALPNDYHPPHDVCLGEQFLARVYAAVRNSPIRDKILLVVTFDEHGGCMDHAGPPWGAKAPQPEPVSRDGTFHYDRFGVRVPTILVSSYTPAGTVFRASGPTPYDHTSLLATLRDWKSKQLAGSFLPSPRIAAAPTVQPLLTLDDSNRRTDWPQVSSTCTPAPAADVEDAPVAELHMSLVVGARAMLEGKHPGPAAVAELRQRVQTTGQAARELKALSDALAAKGVRYDA